MARGCADRENWSNLTSLHTLTVQFFNTVYIFHMYWCAWPHTALSLLIETSELPRSPFPPADPHDHRCSPWFLALCSLSWVACPWSLLDDLLAWLCSVRRSLPTNTRNPSFEGCYEDNGVENTPNVTVIVHVSELTLEVSIPHVKYVVTSRVELVIPPTVTLCRPWLDVKMRNKTKNESWGT